MIPEEKLSKVDFAKNYLYIVTILLTSTVLGLVVLTFSTFLFIMAAAKGIVWTWDTWLSFILMNMLFLVQMILVWFRVLTETSLEFTERTIQKRGFVGVITMNWQEITAIYTIGSRIIIRANNKKMKIDMNFYRHPKLLEKYLRDQFYQYHPDAEEFSHRMTLWPMGGWRFRSKT